MCLEKFIKLTKETSFGFRLFNVLNDCLESPIMNNYWESKEIVAVKEPKPRNNTGIYSLKTMNDLESQQQRYIFENHPQVIVLVKNSGTIAIHQNGYRSSKAEILALTPSLWYSQWTYEKNNGSYELLKKPKISIKLCKAIAKKIDVQYCESVDDLKKFKTKYSRKSVK